MTDKQYEDRYQAALVHIRAEGHAVDTPHWLGEFRYCRIDEEPLTDEEVFTLAWGPQVAGAIIERRDV